MTRDYKLKGFLMLKLFIFSLSLLVLSGCNNLEPKVKTSIKPATQGQVIQKSKKTQVKHEIFQTVLKKDATLLQKGPNKESCAICGMNLVKFYKTSHTAMVNGKNVQYCSLHCMADAIRHGEELENPMVVDVTSLKFIPVTEAYYVVGSSVHGTMSHVSKYAFKSLKDAKAFQKKYGGKILDFYSAWQIAKKDFSK